MGIGGSRTADGLGFPDCVSQAARRRSDADGALSKRGRPLGGGPRATDGLNQELASRIPEEDEKAPVFTEERFLETVAEHADHPWLRNDFFCGRAAGLT